MGTIANDQKAIGRITSGRRISKRARIALILVVGLVLSFWFYFLVAAGTREIRLRHGPNGVALGDDFAIFYSAALLMRDGGNPYDHQRLLQTETQLMARDHRAMLPRTERVSIRAGNPPLFFWALEPLTSLPFGAAAYIWIGGMYAVAALSFICTATWLGWRRLVLPLVAFLLMPQVISGTYVGNLTAVVLAVLGLSLLLLRRYPLLAGLLMSLLWLKPQVALPIAGLIILFQSATPLRTSAGLLLGTLTQLLLTFLITGRESLIRWIQGLAGFSSTISAHANMASLNGIYYRWAPVRLGFVLEMLTVVLALAVTGWWWWRTRGIGSRPLVTSGWLWGLWFLAIPYTHLEDQMLLLAPILALLGRNGLDALGWKQAVALAMLFFSVLFAVASPSSVQLLWVPLVVVTACLALAARDVARPGHALPATDTRTALSEGQHRPRPLPGA